MIEFTLPSMGADMDEGTLLEWKVKPGDVVRKGQVVAIVDTSKAAVDVESWHEGTVYELLIGPHEKIPVGTPMAILLEPGEAPPATKHPDRPTRPATSPGAAARGRVSPAARKLAQQHGIDLDAVTGTGPGSAVTLADVERSIAAQPGPATAPLTAVPLPGMRQVIAAAMERSKREIPHYYVSETIPLERALAWLANENEKRSIVDRLLPAALLLKAVAVTLRRFPDLNGFYRQGIFEPASSVHLGVAISLRQGGLIAPALLDADTKTLSQLMRELLDLTRRCRAGSLRSSELSLSTITVTNLGDRGATEVFGIIYPPQVALVGFGRIVEHPWVDGGALRIMPATTASVSADHRVSDGHRGALFLVELSELLQHPEELNR
ncbi:MULTISPECIES: dihydrolipoamide acetyltransferase family protein [Burkholderia]|uniref:dihydrolipoamide acetyltransferase family protein n=1 Tax=Burkholderia TaxID=32008 RepID=UPI000863A1D0|nr:MULTISPECIES: dihydrolipoamide acetyltransferase family protein [Burkholderia]AOL04213.1 branched-chain alpha-keto acid dehydrogenase subunit E2 [Burkholderia contaminans]TCW70053.1 2-oxo acid dehydrogenase subunit E2 [Burkholderia sp. SRS-25]